MYLGPLDHDGLDEAGSLTDTLINWDLITCTPGCARPWRRRRWRAPRVWTCPGCHTRWTVEGRTWVQLLTPSQVRRLEAELGLTDGRDL